MKPSFNFAAALVLLGVFNLLTTPARAGATAFSYQGRFTDGGSPANGTYDLRFGVFDAVTNGNPIGPTLTNSATSVSNGLFMVALDFGGVFTGTNYWLQIAARTNGASGFIPLYPAQPITPTPYAIYAANAATAGTATTAVTAGSASSVATTNLSGTISLAQLPVSVVTNNASGVTLNGTFTGTGTGLSVTTPTAANFVFAYDTTTQNITSQNSFQSITFNNQPLINGWTHTTGSPTFTCTQTGIYKVDYYVQPATGNPNGDPMTVRGVLNGTEISGSEAVLTAYNNSPETEPEISKSFIVSVASGGSLIFQISDSGSNQGSIAPAGTGSVKPSVACTIVRIQ